MRESRVPETFLAHDVLIMRENAFESSHLPRYLIVRVQGSGPPV